MIKTFRAVVYICTCGTYNVHVYASAGEWIPSLEVWDSGKNALKIFYGLPSIIYTCTCILYTMYIHMYMYTLNIQCTCILKNVYTMWKNEYVYKKPNIT